ncbi:hypothetical protein [Pseudomarimonas arenosa]|uniref:Secreted protein n=1 Tax=Pseudomarimonas arenosa TaxID=2774145 RepID=A0AAW3ZFE8_9GAMM|nr:hypothetical protein [Pseudomarimonas arenosa]MBD8524225.1 hypothetical protein [Pseudomarimonas arenosa]
MTVVRVLLSASLMALSLSAFAAKEQAVVVEPAKFAKQRQSIEAEIANGTRYREIDGEERKAVLSALERLGEQLSKVSAVTELHESDKVAVFNDQELVNSILSRAAADSRMVCRRETQTGSRIPTNVCKTVGQRRREQDAARQIMIQNQGNDVKAPLD